jgi:PPOX class probable F420-dependent enzyme
MTGMDQAEALDFLRTHHHAVLATMRRDGTPQLSPVTVAVDDAGRVIVSTRETAMKTRNVLRTPHAWVCAFTDGFYGPWIQVAGPVEVVHLPEALDLLVDYYRKAAGEHPDWDDYRAAMVRDRRVLLRLTPDTVGPSAEG